MADVDILLRDRGSGGAASSTASVTTSSASVGDYVLIVASVDFRSITDLTINNVTGIVNLSGSAGWTQIYQSADTNEVIKAWIGKVTSSGAKTITCGQNGGTSGLHIHWTILNPQGGSITVDGTPSTNQDRTSPYTHSAITVSGTKSLLVFSQGVVHFTGPVLDFTDATTQIENKLNSFSGLQTVFVSLASAGSSGSRTQSSNVSDTGSGGGSAGGMFALRSQTAGTPPTVDAGADAAVTVNTEFARTATENDNGSAITSRSWKIQTGPAGMGSTLSTSSSVSWTPTTVGTYTLRYSATNANGTSTDDVIVDVTATPPSGPEPGRYLLAY